jgi:hypothetical protein
VNIGDLLRDGDYPECGILLRIRDHKWKYFVLCTDGKPRWFKAEDVEKRCEVISEAR